MIKSSKSGRSRVGYGAPGSIRVDLLEKSYEDKVCVYDIKTGKTGLSAARSNEIAQTVALAYPSASRIIVIETRPTQ